MNRLEEIKAKPTNPSITDLQFFVEYAKDFQWLIGRLEYVKQLADDILTPHTEEEHVQILSDLNAWLKSLEES